MLGFKLKKPKTNNKKFNCELKTFIFNCELKTYK